MKILTAKQMGEVDRRTTEVYRLPGLLLMENAAAAWSNVSLPARPNRRKSSASAETSAALHSS